MVNRPIIYHLTASYIMLQTFPMLLNSQNSTDNYITEKNSGGFAH